MELGLREGCARVHGGREMIAALFVEEDGIYSGRSDVEVWGVTRDARLYAGPWPCVLHPPCQRWGRYWSGGPSARVRRKLGDDGGCFESALASVRQWGGVLEHPEASHAWRTYGLTPPPKSGGWIPAGDGIGHTCCVEQGHYGHRARKATWLYAVGVELPALKWGKAEGKLRLDQGHHNHAERLILGETHQRITARECLATPHEFAELLLSIARTARRDRP
jgi:hypothetical protein